MRGEDNHDKNERILDRCRGGQEVVVQTVNSNGGHVMPTISADEFKGAQAQKDNGGGGTAFIRSFNFELYVSPSEEVIGALCARRCSDWMVYK